MKSISIMLISLAVLLLSAQTAFSAEITGPSLELTYTTDIGAEGTGPISINWEGNWLSISLLPAVAGIDNARAQGYVIFGAYPAGRYERPLSLDLKLTELAEPLDISILPENYRDAVKTIAKMASMTLEKDKEAGKLTADGVAALEKLRVGYYTLSDLSGEYIDVRWSTEYAGKTATRTLNFTGPDLSCDFNFIGGGFTAEVRELKGYNTATAAFRDGILEGGYRRTSAPESMTEKEALLMFRSALNTIEAVFKAAGTKLTDEMAADLLLAKKAFAKGFTSYVEAPYPAMPVAGT